MEKRAYQLGVLQALKDTGIMKEAQGMSVPSVETMKNNIYRQQASQQAGTSTAGLDPMRGAPQTKGPLQTPGIGGAARPEAGIASAAKTTPRPTPQLAGFGGAGGAGGAGSWGAGKAMSGQVQGAWDHARRSAAQPTRQQRLNKI